METDGTNWCLLVDERGAFIGKHSERLRISVKGEVQRECPLLGLEHVLVLGGGVSLSADAVRACAERGIPVTFLGWTGQPYATLLSPDLVGTVQTRRQQLLAYLDQRGVLLAKAFGTGKLQNQANLLKYMAKYRRELNPALYEAAREAAFQIEHQARKLEELEADQVEPIRERAMGLEGQAATLYWEAARRLLGPELGWKGRETRGATDLVNSALNYGYGVLYGHTERAIVLAGLDPYAGFLHEDRPGKPSLVLDLVEEFRQMVVDRTVFGLLNKGVDLKVNADDGRLDDPTRKLLAQKVNERLDGEEPYQGKKPRLKTILQLQARHIATFLRGEGKPYVAWIGRW
ncbi:MAG: CRISPR-associated endonuclease Cas1 [Chloroflexi bacterium]|nr:CRISPR-associated endonuclease Cas1 [Chloroflexota bacterium]